MNFVVEIVVCWDIYGISNLVRCENTEGRSGMVPAKSSLGQFNVFGTKEAIRQRKKAK